MLGNLSEKFESALRKLSGQSEISEANVRESMEEVREALLEADVHYEVVEAFTQRVMQKSLGAEVLKAVEPGQQMIKIVHDELVRLLGGDEAVEHSEAVQAGEAQPRGDAAGSSPIMFLSPGPTVIMMAGLQGSGKTTTCGKLAAWLKKKGKRVTLAAIDLQRPAAVEQLRTVTEQVQAEAPGDGSAAFYGEPGQVAEYGKAVGAAVGVAKRALERSRAAGDDVLILDTAGRLHLSDELMDELGKVAAATSPHHIFLVIDAMTGQDAVNSAKAFNDRLELDGAILTKFDSDTRGGAALSVREVTGKPITFIGTGEKLDALEAFYADRIASRILGMGDVVSLVEKAQEQVSEEEALAMQEKMAAGKMTMDDFLTQLKRIRKMGPMKQILGMLPGIGSALKDLPIDDKQIDRTEAIIQSMTAKERADADLLDNSRRRRVARGSGSEPGDVSRLVKGFEMVGRMSRQMSTMGMMDKVRAARGAGGGGEMGMDPGGMPGLGRKGSSKQSQAKNKFKKRKKRR